MARNKVIARCIVRAMLEAGDEGKRKSGLARILALIAAFFALYKVRLCKVDHGLFAELRKTAWKLDEAKYRESFASSGEAKDHEALQSIATMGFSGSTFFSTADHAYLIKSIPRHFEHSFFSEDLLLPYAEHMIRHQDSTLVRICDMLAAQSKTFGLLLGTVPSHHMVMENLLYGQEQAKRDGDPEWQSWDLKPTSYFFPERDIASGQLTSEATKDRLADEFHDKLMLSQEQADTFLAILERDTELLQRCNAVDYSLFLVRIPKRTVDDHNPFDDPSDLPQPLVPPNPPTWRTGILSADGKYVFRAVILDFFWAKHKTQPRLMTMLIKAYNLVDRKGPMSITTDAPEYRTRFLDMCKGFIEVAERQVHGG